MMTLMPEFWHKIMIPAVVATLQMTFITAAISTVLGFVVAIVLVVTNSNGIRPHPRFYAILSFVVNVVRSFPFIILIIFLVPLTKVIVGTSIGVKGAIVPLTIAATAFLGKIIENSLQEVDQELVEGMKSFGLTDWQVMFKVVLSEALPSTVSGIILATISILGCTAMAGAVGAGGLGAVAIVYGYQSFRQDVMIVTVVALIILVEIIQVVGDEIYKRLKY